MPYNFTTIEKKWQKYWLENKSFRALDPSEAGSMPKKYVLDMFPYPSGAGLHVGHPEGYTATDIYSRYYRMRGYNVLHTMGWDAFGLPAEQHAIKEGIHPAITTRKNIDNFRKQIQMLGLSYDWDREVDTTDPGYYKWTQWIFLQLYNSYFDKVDNKAKPIGHLVAELENENYLVAPDGSIHLNPVGEGMEAIAGHDTLMRAWSSFKPAEQRDIIDGQRLAYTDEAPVNWCPGLGTVLSNEEVIDGKSEVGGFPVERRPMRQWMLRITSYSDRLIEDLDKLDWPDSIKEMQRNWIGRSIGAEVDFEIHFSDRFVKEQTEKLPAGDISLASTDRGLVVGRHRVGSVEKHGYITVFTTRPDTLFGATYVVLAPEHELVDSVTTAEQKQAVDSYRVAAKNKSDRERIEGAREKTGVFTGGYAINPVNEEKIPIWIADYVLTGYGTGAIMAVPAHDERDFEFAKVFGLPIRAVIQPTRTWLAAEVKKSYEKRDPRKSLQFRTPDGKPMQFEDLPAETQTKVLEAGKAAATAVIDKLSKLTDAEWKKVEADYYANPAQFGSAFTEMGVSVNSDILNGLATPQAKERMIETLEREGTGRQKVNYKLRDWLFSRQRYWGEPFPVVLDENHQHFAVQESELPVTLPEMSDFKPTGTPEPPLSKATDWLKYSDKLTRETNTMPQWAGSCWYYLRYIDPKNPAAMVDESKEEYWMPVDLYVGGVEHAVLHLLYARFWHKVLFDLGHVSTVEPFQKLVNQGMILGETEYHFFESPAGPVSVSDVRDIDEEAQEKGGPKMFGYHKVTGEKIYATRVIEPLVEKKGDRTVLKANANVAVDARSFKMSKSRGNVVNPDNIVRDYGADAFRMYEMYMGPLEAQKPWNTRDIVGLLRLISSIWRNLVGDEEENKLAVISAGPVPDDVDRQLHRAIKKIAEDIEGLRFNTAIAELFKLNNAITGLKEVPKELAEKFTLLVAPFAPHLAEELWQRLGHSDSLAREPWPTYDPAKLVDTTIEIPVQVNGKLRDKVIAPADASDEDIFKLVETSEKVRPWIEGKSVKKRVYVPKKLVNYVVA